MDQSAISAAAQAVVEAPSADTPHISITTGILVALSASWLSSLGEPASQGSCNSTTLILMYGGLTIQRKSHLQNERHPVSMRKRDFKRPLWLLGFAIFITSNILGSVFQIGALSITLLAPLGAVSLLWNAFFARILLGDVFSRYLIFGTILIAGGAVLIAIFGVVQEKTHTLEELVLLYMRPSFIVWMVIQLIVLVALLGAAHWRERAMEQNLQDVYIAIPGSPGSYHDTDEASEDENDSDTTLRKSVSAGRKTLPPAQNKNRKVRRWSTPPSYLALGTGDTRGGDDQHEESTLHMPDTPISAESALSTAPNTPGVPTKSTTRSSRHVSFGQTKYRTFGSSLASTPASTPRTTASEAKSLKRGFRKPPNVDTTIQPRFSSDRSEKMRLWLGIAYGSASGTMSGLCLLFAKTGVELLILTVVGQNQFTRWESWMIVLALLVCALLQLYYLNKSLRLVGPTLICPLAFCFYNLSSIFNGLMYYDQWSRLTPLQDGLMSLGIAILLGGVWIVSIKSPADQIVEDIDLDECSSDDDDEEANLFTSGRNGRDSFDVESGRSTRYRDDAQYDVDEDDGNEMEGHQEETFGDLKNRIASLYQAFLADQAGPPRGFSVGISASSPGFAIRPTYKHSRRNTTFHVPAQLRISTDSSPAASPGVRHTHTRSDDFAAPTSAPSYITRRPSESLTRTASEPIPGQQAEGAATAANTREGGAILSHRHRRKRSLAGEYYVGATDPFAEEPVLSPEGLHNAGLMSPTSPKYGRTRANSSASANRNSSSGPLPHLTRGLSHGEETEQGPHHGRLGSLARYLPSSGHRSIPKTSD